MTRYYLLDHPPASQQFYPPPRANGLTGGVVLHTTESPKQRIGADNGAINIAGFISRRSDPGSYHCIVDSGSTVLLVPDNYTAFHVAANGYNSRTWGISFACRSTELAPDDEWTQLAMKQAAAAIVAFWQRNRFDPAACAVMRPAPDVLNMSGLTTHGDAQPWDRSDAWTRSPHRLGLEALLLAEIAALVNPPVPEEDDMKPLEMWRDPATGSIWLFWTGPWRTGLKTQEDVKAYQMAGIPFRGDFPTTEFGAMKLRNTQWVKTG